MLLREVEESRRDKMLEINVVKALRVLNCEEDVNVKLGRCFQIFYHLVDRMQVWMASLVSKKESM